ncbi:MAG: glycosyltransferase family 2 protein [Phycisphaerae bacterium]|nr:glycosyltransferase family 2 protein [Phycisphaerae bacterium]
MKPHPTNTVAEEAIRLDIVIPLLNEEENIPVLIARLQGVEGRLENAVVSVYCVDDHSMDRTRELLRDACEENPTFHYLRLSTNSGSHVAILAGLEQTRGDCAVFLAADLQDPPELIPKLLSHWRDGSHIVWAVREERAGISWTMRVLSNVFYWLLTRVCRVRMQPRGSDFALLDRKVIDALLRSAGTNPSIGGAIARLGYDSAEVLYHKEPRKLGTSKWTWRAKLRAFADAFVSFSYVPLRAMSYVGMACSLLGFLYAFIVIIVRLITDEPIEGWASLMVVLLVMGGIQMTMLGILGEYLWRTLEAARHRPLYFLEETRTGQSSPPASDTDSTESSTPVSPCQAHLQKEIELHEIRDTARARDRRRRLHRF